MSANIKVDAREFTETLRKLAVLSSRDLPDFINSRAFHIAKKAREHTPVASRSEIEASLGATLQSQKTDKKGRVRRKYNYKPTPIVYAIVNSRRKRAGLDALAGGEMASAAKSFVTGRLRSIGLLKNGWGGALGKLAGAVKESINRGPRVKQSSDARVARNGFSPTAEFVYKLLSGNKEQGNQRIDERTVAATERAFAEEHQEMLRKLEEKLTTTAKKAGAL